METRKRRGFPQDLGKASMRNSRLYHTFHKRRRRRPQPNAALTGTGFGTAVFFHEKLPTTNREDRAKEGWTRHQVNGPVPLTARTGWFVQLPIIGGLNEPPRLRPLRRLRRFFLNGAQPPLVCQGGEFLLQKPAQMSKLRSRARRLCHRKRHQKISLTPSWTWREVVRVLVIRP